MNCPQCGNPMEEGFMVAESLLGGAKWTTKKVKLALAGEPVARPDGVGNVYVHGSRCAACRLMLLRY